MTSKQRAYLRGMGNSIEPSCQIGKTEISAAQIADLDAQLEKRELVKITVLRTSAVTAKEAADILASRLQAETVAVTGAKILLYRRSKSDKITHIAFDVPLRTK